MLRRWSVMPLGLRADRSGEVGDAESIDSVETEEGYVLCSLRLEAIMVDWKKQRTSDEGNINGMSARDFSTAACGVAVGCRESPFAAVANVRSADSCHLCLGLLVLSFS
jgi:hypothetical protein